MGSVGLRVLRIQLSQLVAKLSALLLETIDFWEAPPQAIDRSVQGNGHIGPRHLTVYHSGEHLKSIADVSTRSLPSLDGSPAVRTASILSDRYSLTAAIAQPAVD
jgi:hypothetical protein